MSNLVAEVEAQLEELARLAAELRAQVATEMASGDEDDAR